MSTTRAIRRVAGILAWLASVLLASLAAAPAAGPGRLPPKPPGWVMHPPPPAQVHAALTGSIPSSQIILIAAVAALAAAALAVSGYRVRAVRRRVTAGAA
jgi:hypothetical protein